MKHKVASPPYKHICPSCGRHQEVMEYDTDPQIDVGDVQTVEGGEVWDLQIVINQRKKFTCVACSYSKRLRCDPTETGHRVRIPYEKVDNIEAATFAARQQAQQKIDDLESYL